MKSEFNAKSRVERPEVAKRIAAQKILASGTKSDDQKLREVFELYHDEICSQNSELYNALFGWNSAHSQEHLASKTKSEAQKLYEMFERHQNEIRSWNTELYYALLGWKYAHLREFR